MLLPPFYGGIDIEVEDIAVLKGGRDGALWLSHSKSLANFGPSVRNFWPFDLLHFGTANVRKLHFMYHCCDFLVYLRKAWVESN